ncbi:MAG: YidC/Oxa1 family membrane protein insertase [Actinobacteria bacterium]|nr:YidC/Oxa1 family membrane protein insertase [Actinomycetota bacterium]
MGGLIDAFGALTAFFYNLIPNWGISIILITVTIRLLLYPLTAKQARSMAKMQRVQPEIKKLQEKHKHDRQKLNEELMAFYKEHQINPMAGCLPLLLQFPIFIGLFQVLRSPYKHIPVGTDLFRAFCDNSTSAAACNNPKGGLPRGLSFLSMDLSRGASADHGSVVDALPFFLLIGLVIASGWFQSRQMTRLQRGRATAQSQMMTRIFPLFFGVISYSLPAGVVLYFFVSNLWQIGQQAVIFGREPETVGAKGKPSGRHRAAADKQRSDPKPAPGGRRAKPEKSEAVIEAEAREIDDVDAETTGTDTGSEDASAQAAPRPPAKSGGRSGAEARPNRAKARKKKKRKRRR